MTKEQEDIIRLNIQKLFVVTRHQFKKAITDLHSMVDEKDRHEAKRYFVESYRKNLNK